MRLSTETTGYVTDMVGNLRETIGLNLVNVNSRLSGVDIYDLTAAYKDFTSRLVYDGYPDDDYMLVRLFQIGMEVMCLTAPPLEDVSTLVNEDIVVELFTKELAAATHAETIGNDGPAPLEKAIQIITAISNHINIVRPSPTVRELVVPLHWIIGPRVLMLHIGVLNDT
ncbi:MAG: hypothetical protein Q9M19_01035 [Mariprofundaceae bacterium]|nr:hypothetical protein [Mariprofundaceae bacterium]